MDEYEQVQHPLLIDLVLEHLFHYLNVRDLLTCRLVCSQWGHLAAKPLPLKQNRMVCIPDSDRLYDFLNTLLQSANPQIWTRFEVELDSLAPNDSELLINAIGLFLKQLVVRPGNNISLVRLFTLIRSLPELECLELEGLREMVINELSRSVSRYLNYQLSVNRIEELEEWISTEPSFTCPKLKHLKIAIQIESSFPNTSFAFFQILFKIFPHLNHLQVSCLDMADIGNTTIQGTVQALEQSSILPTLTSLRIDDLNEDGLGKLVNLHSAGLRLKKLQLLSFIDVSSSTLENLIRSQAETLEELSIGGEYLQGGTTLRLQNLIYPFVLPRLKVLNFAAAVDIAQRITYIQTIAWELDYAAQLPNLEVLGLHYFTSHSYSTLFPPGVEFEPCLNLRQLIIAGELEAVKENNLVLMGILFPNVTDLKVTIRKGSCIPTIFSTWQKLESLELNVLGGLPKLDEWLTGVVIPIGANSYTHKPMNEFHELSNETTGRMSLVALKELRSLKIWIDLRQSLVRVNSGILPSDLTAMLAIRPLKNLKKLVINRSDITANCLQILRTDLNLEKCIVGDRTGNKILFDCDNPNSEEF